MGEYTLKRVAHRLLTDNETHRNAMSLSDLRMSSSVLERLSLIHFAVRLNEWNG